MKNKPIELIITLIIVVLIAGFYLVLSNIQEVKEDTQNLSLNLDLLYEKTVGDTVTPESNATSTTESEQGDEDIVNIPTAIIFQTESSPLLTPQTNITVTVDNISKSENGTVILDITAYTNKADSFSALQGNNIFEVINLSDTNQKPLKVEGNFDSIPPKSKVSGEVTFKVDENKDEVILKVQSNDGMEYYRFNFENQSYEEAILG